VIGSRLEEKRHALAVPRKRDQRWSSDVTGSGRVGERKVKRDNISGISGTCPRGFDVAASGLALGAARRSAWLAAALSRWALKMIALTLKASRWLRPISGNVMSAGEIPTAPRRKSHHTLINQFGLSGRRLVMASILQFP
jgi:hypothetical protein